MEDRVPKERRKAWSRFVTIHRKLFQLELRVLIALILVLLGVWGFVTLADAVVGEKFHPLDEQILLAMRSQGNTADPIGPLWIEEFMRDITALGGTGVLIFITLSVLGYLLIRQNYRTILLLMMAVPGAFLISLLLKVGFDRPRPELVAPITATFNPSFPSGHAMLAAAVYLTLGTLLARLHPRRRLKVYILSLAVLLTIAVGISRVYLGVHWPSDVLAGWTAGAIWALFVWLISRWLLS